MPIDIEAPGGDEAALAAAIYNLTSVAEGWTVLTADGTESIMGQTFKKFLPTFAMTDDSSIEIEAILVRADPNVNSEIAVHSGTHQARLSYQSDGNRLLYWDTGSGSAIDAAGTTDLCPGVCKLYLRVAIENSSQFRMHGIADGQRVPATGSRAIGTDWTAATLRVYCSNVTVVAIRARKVN